MGKIRKPAANELYVPEFSYQDDNGFVKNRENDVDCQIKAKISFCNMNQYNRYLGLHTFEKKTEEEKAEVETRQEMYRDYDSCIINHVHNIYGLEDFGIKNGKDLIEHEPFPFLNELIIDLFAKICGTKSEDKHNEKKSDH